MTVIYAPAGNAFVPATVVTGLPIDAMVAWLVSGILDVVGRLVVFPSCVPVLTDTEAGKNDKKALKLLKMFGVSGTIWEQPNPDSRFGINDICIVVGGTKDKMGWIPIVFNIGVVTVEAMDVMQLEIWHRLPGLWSWKGKIVLPTILDGVTDIGTSDDFKVLVTGDGPTQACFPCSSFILFGWHFESLPWQ